MTASAVTEVSSEADSASCGFPFEFGRRYRVFASTQGDGTLYTRLCSGTTPVSAAATHGRPVTVARQPSEGDVRNGVTAGVPVTGLATLAGAAALGLLGLLRLRRRR